MHLKELRKIARKRVQCLMLSHGHMPMISNASCSRTGTADTTNCSRQNAHRSCYDKSWLIEVGQFFPSIQLFDEGGCIQLGVETLAFRLSHICLAHILKLLRIQHSHLCIRACGECSLMYPTCPQSSL